MSGGPRPRAAGTGGGGAAQLRPPASCCDSCQAAVAAAKAPAAAPTQAPAPHSLHSPDISVWQGIMFVLHLDSLEIKSGSRF